MQVLNTIDMKPIDFIGALELIIHQISISNENNSSAKHTLPGSPTSDRTKRLNDNDAQAPDFLHGIKELTILDGEVMASFHAPKSSVLELDQNNMKLETDEMLDSSPVLS